MSAESNPWPELDWANWEPTASTLHMWTQIVGKVRLALSPMQAHWWNVPLYVSARGLSTSAMQSGGEMLDIEFDFVSHELHFRLSTGASLSIPLRAQTVADFYRGISAILATAGRRCTHPSHADGAPEPDSLRSGHGARLLRSGVRASLLARPGERGPDFSEVLVRLRRQSQPVHFFWGSFDLAVTRFSGRRAPERPGADAVTREAYSHEVISAGFWPGNGGYGEAAFYCYAAPSPAGLTEARVEPATAALRHQVGRVPAEVQRCPQRAIAGRGGACLFGKHLRRCRRKAGWDRDALERNPSKTP